MKCPKCSYLGFETGLRCKNCGYDFSLMAPPAEAATPDPIIRRDDVEAVTPELWLDRTDRPIDDASHRATTGDRPANVPVAPQTFDSAEEPALPLFNPHDLDDTPLVSLPVAPRPPLSVRRTPPVPRLRAVPRAPRGAEPALNFIADPADDDMPEPPHENGRFPRTADTGDLIGTRDVGGRRLLAALIDHAMLLGIDLSVVYFTLRIAGLDAGDIRALPLAPLLAFLILLKVAYFTAFTAVGGQTIGKMAVRIRVVGDDGDVDGIRAARRTLTSTLSLLPLGLGFLPVFFGDDRRALHDRLTHTRVVGLPSA
jgi:uncharacterized RDD family membrane protein YckC